ncbi:MAG: transcriptional repressor [Brevundimonas sp.]|nr:MAG: transcriptional repressor [Brevundimonas sp.]
MSSCDHDHDHRPSDAAALDAVLAGAVARAEERGERMTAPRRRVLRLLLEAGEPVKAYDLIARFGEDGQAAKPPTVYRALEFLEKQGLAHRIASVSAYVACADTIEGDDAEHAAAFLICDCCGAAREVRLPAGKALTQAASDAGYVIERTTVEAHGRCPACRVSA